MTAIINTLVDQGFALPFDLSVAEAKALPDEEHTKLLEEKYGADMCDRSRELAKRMLENPRNTQYRDEFFSFVYRTGMCEDCSVLTSLRTRVALIDLLKELVERQEKFNIVDLGTGDGRLAINLATNLEALGNLYAVDSNPSALQRMNVNIGNLDKDVRTRVHDVIVPIQADYTSPEFRREFSRHTRTGEDIIIGAFMNDGAGLAFPFVGEYIQNGGSLVIYGNHFFDPDGFSVHYGRAIPILLEDGLYQERIEANSHGIELSLVDIFWDDFPPQIVSKYEGQPLRAD